VNRSGFKLSEFHGKKESLETGVATPMAREEAPFCREANSQNARSGMTPCVTSITIDGDTFLALSAHFSVSAMHDVGMPQMGTLVWSIEATIDMHDTKNIPFATLRKLFKLASTVTKESVKDIKVEFWTDDSRTDAICTYSFQGWISHYSNSSGGGGNHTLTLSLQPKLDTNQYANITMSN